MFRAIWKNSLKTLVRLWTFWVVVAALAAMILHQGLTDYVGYAPGYEPSIFTYHTYVQGIAHRMNNELRFTLPFFAVAVTALPFISDCDDGFFEIDNAGM